MDEAKLKRQQDRASRAQRILDDELFKGAFENIEQTIVDSWKESRADEEKQRYNAYIMHRLLQNLREQFTRAIVTGQAAKKELLTIKEPSKLRRLIG